MRHPPPERLRFPDPPPLPDLPIPLWFRFWVAICAVVGVGFLGLLAWAIFAIVSKVTR